jgi:hypothetical protein
MNGDLLRTLPDHVLATKVFTYFGFKDYALTGCASQYAQAHWQTANRRKPMPLYVPEDCRTLEEAVARVEQDSRITTIVLGEGEHVVEMAKDEWGHDHNTLVISSNMSIVGRPDVPKEKIVVVGGIHSKKIHSHHTVPHWTEGNCHLQHMTLRKAMAAGVYGMSSFTMDDVIVEQCGAFGVVAYGTGVVGRCTNVEVRQCGDSGVVASKGASITLIGATTTVQHNCTIGKSDTYGLQVWNSSSTIQLVSPLTKEQVSIDNGGGGNCGASSWADINKIKTIDAPVLSSAPAGETKTTHESPKRDDLLRLPDHVLTTKVFTYFGFKDYALTSCACTYSQAHWQMANQNTPLPLYVPEDCRTLKEAVERVKQDGRITTIILGKGEHHIIGFFLEISSAMRIVGRPDVPKEKIVILPGLGGIHFKEGIQGTCHLQHITLRQAKSHGVAGKSSFTMEDVLVEQCGMHGVGAYGTGVIGRCTNVEVRQCGWSGVLASSGASITLIGAKTTVHGNCTKISVTYGLQVYGASSTVQLVSPLTKETVAVDNGGGGNWGVGAMADINQIKTIAPSNASLLKSPVSLCSVFFLSLFIALDHRL